MIYVTHLCVSYYIATGKHSVDELRGLFYFMSIILWKCCKMRFQKTFQKRILILMTDSVHKSEESMLLNECPFLIIIKFPVSVQYIPNQSK